MTAPTAERDAFDMTATGGTLYVPVGSTGYDVWVDNSSRIGLYNWTKVEQ